MRPDYRYRRMPDNSVELVVKRGRANSQQLQAAWTHAARDLYGQQHPEVDTTGPVLRFSHQDVRENRLRARAVIRLWKQTVAGIQQQSRSSNSHLTSKSVSATMGAYQSRSIAQPRWTSGSTMQPARRSTMARNQVTAADLQVMVADLVAQWVAAGRAAMADPNFDLDAEVAQVVQPVSGTPRVAFTAYNVTVALRDANPSFDIGHQTVRSLVAGSVPLLDAVQAGVYTRSNVTMPNGDNAHVYHPNVTPAPAVTAAPALAAPADPTVVPGPVVIAGASGSTGLVDNDPISL